MKIFKTMKKVLQKTKRAIILKFRGPMTDILMTEEKVEEILETYKKN